MLRSTWGENTTRVEKEGQKCILYLTCGRTLASWLVRLGQIRHSERSKRYLDMCMYLFYFYFFLLPLFFIFPTTDLKYNNLCNYSACLSLAILSSFLAYLSLNYFSLHDILCTKQIKMVVVVKLCKHVYHFGKQPDFFYLS